MNHTNYIESVAANETSWQNTFDDIELLETNYLRFKDIDFVDLEQSLIEPRQESKDSTYINDVTSCIQSAVTLLQG